MANLTAPVAKNTQGLSVKWSINFQLSSVKHNWRCCQYQVTYTHPVRTNLALLWATDQRLMRFIYWTKIFDIWLFAQFQCHCNSKLVHFDYMSDIVNDHPFILGPSSSTVSADLRLGRCRDVRTGRHTTTPLDWLKSKYQRKESTKSLSFMSDQNISVYFGYKKIFSFLSFDKACHVSKKKYPIQRYDKFRFTLVSSSIQFLR